MKKKKREDTKALPPKCLCWLQMYIQSITEKSQNLYHGSRELAKMLEVFNTLKNLNPS